ncbi:hypothetical protein Tco_1144977 [Tanacetum coccineum]
METVFRISNCSVESQIKFATCTLLAGALTWWNSHVMTVTHDVAYSMTWVVGQNLKARAHYRLAPSALEVRYSGATERSYQTKAL